MKEVKASLDKLSTEQANFVRKSLAALALQDRRASVLKLCLDQGNFAFEHYFEDAANKFQNASDDTETLKVLEESRFRKLYPLPIPGADGGGGDESEGAEEPCSVFDAGGSLPVDW